LDVYIGGAFTDDSSVRFETFAFGNFSIPTEWDDSVAAGLRGGYWLPGPLRWLGLGADLSYFKAEVSSLGPGLPAGGTLKFHLVPLSPLAMVRIPLLRDDGFEGGRIQPYAAVGPGLFLSILTSDVTSGSEAGFDVGLDARAGVAVMLTSTLGLYAEYRRTDVNVNISDSFNDEVKSKLKTDHINGGLALRF
jgi:opacity protein-like surface antigen